jgi:DNA-binding transcriptional ArsR family regulator
MLKLANRTREFWGAGEEGFPEILAIAQHRGQLLDLDLDDFLAELPATALRTDDLSLASETAEVREMIIGRLDRLRADAGLRRRYLTLLRDLWAAVRPDWDATGKETVARACVVARRRLDAGEQPSDLIPHLSELVINLVRRPGTSEVVVAPGYFTGRCVWELPGVILVGLPAEGGGDVAELRARAEGLAQRVKAISDPTRLAILLRLGKGPASITDVTREFGISQPAVSVHFRLLREAEMVSGVRDGGRTLYNLDSGSAAGLLQDLSSALLPAAAGHRA